MSVPITVTNPQSNKVVERFNQILKTTIAISLQENPPCSYEEVSSLIQRKCTAAQFTICTTVNSQSKLSTGKMALYGGHILNTFAKQNRLETNFELQARNHWEDQFKGKYQEKVFWL